eukprot:6477960-Amphidinium_carterae.1
MSRLASNKTHTRFLRRISQKKLEWVENCVSRLPGHADDAAPAKDTTAMACVRAAPSTPAAAEPQAYRGQKGRFQRWKTLGRQAAVLSVRL